MKTLNLGTALPLVLSIRCAEALGRSAIRALGCAEALGRSAIGDPGCTEALGRSTIGDPGCTEALGRSAIADPGYAEALGRSAIGAFARVTFPTFVNVAAWTQKLLFDNAAGACNQLFAAQKLLFRKGLRSNGDQGNFFENWPQCVQCAHG